MNTTKQTIASAIVWNKYIDCILVKPNPDKDIYQLPKLKLKIGADPIKELKYELETEHKIKTRFIKTLPDSWAKLLHLHTKVKKVFYICYLFQVIEEVENKNNYNWLPVDKPDIIKLENEDKEAVEFFVDLFKLA